MGTEHWLLAVKGENFGDWAARVRDKMNFSGITDSVQEAVLGAAFERLRRVESLTEEDLESLRAEFQAAYRAKNKLHSWDMEVFAAGTWTGSDGVSRKFTAADLDAMVASYEALHGGGYLNSPLKFGHNTKQPLTDGQPALGWVEKLKRVGKKLIATVIDVPAVVYNAIEGRRYDTASIELDFGVSHKGTHYPFVVTGVALLGADLPAVNTLASLSAYMQRGQANTSKVCYSATLKGEKMAEISDSELAALRARADRADKVEADNTALKERIEKAEGQVADYSRQAEQREAQEKREKITKNRKDVNQLLDDAVTSLAITPAQRTAFSTHFQLDSDEAVLDLNVDNVRAMLPQSLGGSGTGSRTYSAPGGSSGSESEDPGDWLHQQVVELRRKNPDMSYSRALGMVSASNPGLVRESLQLDS